MTLQTLLRFLRWIPLAYVFESPLIEVLAMKFFPEARFRNRVLECLTEIVGLDLANVSKRQEYVGKVLQMYSFVVGNICSTVIFPTTNIQAIYESGEEEAQAFVQHLSNFITACLKNHLTLLESSQAVEMLMASLDLLLRISVIQDTVIFKICLEFWLFFVTDLYQASTKKEINQLKSEFSFNSGALGGMKKKDPRVMHYSPVLSKLRLVMISQMAKPEEVTIVENENGEVVREVLKDTDMITLYKTMREALIYLTNLDPEETTHIMLQKLDAQVDGSEYSWHNLNTLCWAIGSISGALSERGEKHFLVSAIRALLSLCEVKRGKNHKAIIASNIMYVVGQYPRFLKTHWRFLKTVVNKLFEFMHEKFEGVQQMACETFLKIALKCRNQFVVPQLPEDPVPYVEHMLEHLGDITRDLDAQDVHTFYEALGHIVRSEARPDVRQRLVLKMMEIPNQAWATFVAMVNCNPHLLWDMKNIRELKKILKTNKAVAGPVGEAFIVQMSRIYVEMLKLYEVYSQYVSDRIREQGPIAAETIVVRGIKSVKGDILLLIKAFVETGGALNRQVIIENFLPLLVEVVLRDYSSSLPLARDASVLLVFGAIIDTMSDAVLNMVPSVLQTIFPCTIEMITQNFEDFPEHRINFFVLLRSINKSCFKAFFMISEQEFKLIYDAIVWAVRHLERNVGETGLNTLAELLVNVEKEGLTSDFYSKYYILVLQEVLSIMTDTLHKSGFAKQVEILSRLVGVVDRAEINVPIWKPEDGTFPTNAHYVHAYITDLLHKAFPHMHRAHVEEIVGGMFALYSDENKFRVHMRDFLIQLKEFSAADNSELFADEQTKAHNQEVLQKAQVPGMLAPSEIEGDRS
eukprot:TRINITY_DN1767_c0_g1_i4.p1 TRINITY_DN1767_c0_g1~~TRINITY_DN1767_c0_g1_i4.p1  ORF type:complete len:862 (+),score=248.53 TRINITY_DN1767_c0_g1_i4:116-2701(+)